MTVVLGNFPNNNNNLRSVQVVYSSWILNMVTFHKCPILGKDVPIIRNMMNPEYLPLAATALKPQQTPMFLHISAIVGGRRWSPHTSEQKGSMLKPQEIVS